MQCPTCGGADLRRPDGQQFEVEAEHLTLAAGTVLEVFLAEEDGTLTSIGTMTVDAEGDAKLEFETDDGDALRLGVVAIEEFAGRAVEVRLQSDGSLPFSGEVPTPT